MIPSNQSGPSVPSSAPTIEVLYFDGCPSYEHAVALLRKALAAERIPAPIQLIHVETDTEACQYGFYGSPTIRVNGEDITPLPAGATPHLACRVYRRPDGQLAPADQVSRVGIGTRVRMVFSDVAPGLALPQWTIDETAPQPANLWRYPQE